MQLVNWLHEQNRHAESIAILEPLVKAHPDSMHYRCLLMTAYFRSGAAGAVARFGGADRCSFPRRGPLDGRKCRRVRPDVRRLQSVGESGRISERSNFAAPAQPGRAGTINDGELSSLYQALADAHSALGHTKDAVDAASAAIVCWGPQQQQRRDAMMKLKQVLEAAKDLAEYVAQLNAETEKTGQDSPICAMRSARHFNRIKIIRRPRSNSSWPFNCSRPIGKRTKA